MAESDNEVEIPETQTRAYWNQRAENLRTEDNVADFLAHLQIVDSSTFEIALPTLCIAAAATGKKELVSDAREREFERICSSVLEDPESTRPSRRAALACLKEFRNSAPWTDFYTLVEALEEPQFHIIRPILPRFDTLLQSVAEQKIPFRLAQIVISRAILHTNGWIRTWAIEKLVGIDADLLKKNTHVIKDVLIPNLNNNDVFWRHLEKGKMESFLTSLSEVFKALKSEEHFLESILEEIEKMSCPTAIYFVVPALRSVNSAKVQDSHKFLTLMRRVVLKAKYIPYKSMRIVTIRNLIVFFAKITVLDEIVIDELANLIAFITPDATQTMFDSIFAEFQEIFISTGYKVEESHDENMFRERSSQKSFKNLREKARMFWIVMANDREKQEKMMAKVQLAVSESLGENGGGGDLTSHLFLLKEKPEDVKCSDDVLSLLHNELGEYILTRVISNQGSKSELHLLHDLYLPLFIKYCSSMFLPFALAIVKILPESGRSCESTALLMTFLDGILEELTVEKANVLAAEYFVYLGGKEEIGMKRQKKSIDEYDTKEFNKIVATLHSLRIKILNKFTSSITDPNVFLSECVEQLDVASAFSVKQQICRLIARFIPSSDKNVALQCIRAAANIVNEEKKSLNSLPALEAFVDVALSAGQISEDVTRECIQILESQLFIASQSTPVALIIVDAVTKHRKNLDVAWAPFVVKLALFGPVPKKESRVISFAYQKMFEEEDGLLAKDQIERLDEVVQKARFKAVLLALRLPWVEALITEIFEASRIMDKSSSRSFGLSMAHRQKTRAVQLLHLLAEKIDDLKLAEKIFDFCIACVVDPCQQFSIKLIVEWTLALLCVEFSELFAKITDKGFETNMAAQRIGSMCSWLNVLMLISRAVPKYTDACLDKVIVWCTAQNFPVRCTALAAARLMFSTFDKDKKKKWRIVKAIVNFDAEPSGNSKRVIDNLCSDFYFSKLDIDAHFDFQTILSEISKRTGMPPEETIPQKIIVELTESEGYTAVAATNIDHEFLEAPSEVYSALSKNASSAPTMEEEIKEDEQEEDVGAEEEDVPSTSASFQRKIVKEEGARDEDISLIVVASLVDKPNNLGGICRTSEIFGVDVLVVADILVAQDSNFKALSMSSESWQRIEAVKPSNLLPYLQNLRANGYTVIAAEQTTDSVMMHDFKFPKKTVIVMGDEKEGVPVNLLRAVDQTVEIKQVGHTRSLNVHVTAALMIAKFAEQVRFAPS